jgi:hypothetical protein
MERLRWACNFSVSLRPVHKKTSVLIYFAPLFFLLWALIAQVRRNRQVDTRALVACTFVIVLIAGLRWDSDVDYEPYTELYDDTPALSEFTQESATSLPTESGYLLFSSTFKTVGSEFFVLAFACALISLVSKAIAARALSAHASLALCLYLCLHFITTEFIQMRWAVATGLLCLGFCFQYLQKYKFAVLCFLLAPAFQYFSLFFWVVALLVALEGYERFYLAFAVSFLGALFLKVEYFRNLLLSDSDIYIMTRLSSYVFNPETSVGILSLAKLLLFPAIYMLCVRYRPSYPWRTDRLNLFLFKLSLISLSATLLMTFLPILHFRATVIADFFSIIWVLNAMDKAFDAGRAAASYAFVSVLFCVWYLVDLSNYMHSGFLMQYHTWLTAVR